jgi:hypothetical protein
MRTDKELWKIILEEFQLLEKEYKSDFPFGICGAIYRAHRKTEITSEESASLLYELKDYHNTRTFEWDRNFKKSKIHIDEMLFIWHPLNRDVRTKFIKHKIKVSK